MTVRAENYGQDATGRPSLGLLLQLQDHISALFVVLEEVDVVDDQDEGFFATCCTSQCNLF
jgi:hypothetical protein